MDNHTKEQRHKNMQAVKNKDSQIEVMLRKELWRRGLRYQKNCKKVFGKPDIVFSVKKSLYFATASFGTDTIGRTRKMKLNLAENFGFPK